MDFAARRQEALEKTRRELRRPLTADQVLVHAWRCVQGKPKALERWLFAVLPEVIPTIARAEVAKNGSDAWNEQGRGAAMDEQGWKALRAVCKGRAPNLHRLAETAGKNLYALLGAHAMAEMIDKAGGMGQLARMTQRDCMRLGDESGTFGGRKSKSILERHELATNERSLRVLSSRAVLAARLDVYKGQYKGDSLRQEVLYAQ
jgi:hypothetical protein